MRNPNSFDDLITYGIGGIVGLIILYYCWNYIVGFLALCGAFYLFYEYRKEQDDQNRRH